MIVGKGLLAQTFELFSKDKDVLLFCSGVSNSTCTSESEFEREKILLKENLYLHQDKHFIYFSTCSIYDPTLRGQAYVNHKLMMEGIIQEKHPRYSIFRLSNLAGQTSNQFTILNYLYSAIRDGITFELWQHAERNIIDVTDVFKTVSCILDDKLFINKVVNIANTQNYPVVTIVEVIEKFLSKKGVYKLIDKGAGFPILLNEVMPIYQKMNIRFQENYLYDILYKYYSR
ncbi:MAG: hypothetical protein JNJ58_11715 [Chitinophagaceae bacterium]|nr:hypothetical protein [Chitinophagaceae bacterium]